MDELYALAEARDGLLTSKEARSAGIADLVLVRLVQRGRLERVSRGGWHLPLPNRPFRSIPRSRPVDASKPGPGVWALNCLSDTANERPLFPRV
jgi:hypothetical protein